ncbi:MAG: hypothetical protein Q7J78_06380, partial [Clostridiales bacterium]|nr:hypothetical protein [Clostridiales bacterium]
MTGREKIQAAFSRDGSSEIPGVICYEGIYYRDAWDKLTSSPWWYLNSHDLGHQMAWRTEIMDKIKLDWYDLPECLSRAERENEFIEADGHEAFYVNKASGTKVRIVRPEPGGRIINPEPERIVETTEEIDMLIGDLGNFQKEAFLEEGHADLASKLRNGHGKDRMPLGGRISSPLWNCYFLWGFEGFMTMVAVEPGLVKHACERYIRNSL